MERRTITMKKFNGRLVVSAILASALISMSAVSAGAISYGDDVVPDTPTPVSPAKPATTDTTSETDAATEVGDVVTDEAVTEALKAGGDEVTIDVTESANGVTVQESAIAEIAKGDTVVTFNVGSGDTAYTVSIDPASITDAKAINIAMQVIVDTPETEIDGVDIPEGATIIIPVQKGEFGMTLTITLPAAALGNIDVDNASLYYISDNGDVTKIDGQFTSNNDGTVTVSISHASAYVIAEEEPVSADDDVIDDDDDTVIEDDDDDAVAEIADDKDSDVQSGKTDETPIVISNESTDADGNPGTGVSLALGALAASAAAVVVAKKRK